MKKITLIAFIAFSIPLLGYSQTKNFIDQPYIEINGFADSLVTPNQIFIKITISEKDTRDRISVEDLESKMVDSLKGIGIETEKYLTTEDIGSNFRFYLLKRKDILKTKQYILEVPDAEIATKVFILLEDLEISNTFIARIDHTDIENIKIATRTKAVENAKQKAISLTKPLGQAIGPAIYISESDVPNTNLSRYDDGLSEVVVIGYSSKKKDKSIPKIQFKKIKIFTNVNIKFILK